MRGFTICSDPLFIPLVYKVEVLNLLASAVFTSALSISLSF